MPRPPTSRPSSVADMPAPIPVFPLQGALLLPGARLPLNIFEPRYLAMVDDALAGHRTIGMIQPKVPEQTVPDDRPPLYDLGCAGRIVSFEEAHDGRYLISLRGLCRFGVAGELDLHNGYRRVRPDYGAWAVRFRAPGRRRHRPGQTGRRAEILSGRPAAGRRLGYDREDAHRRTDLDRCNGLPVLADRETGAAAEPHIDRAGRADHFHADD